MIKIIIGRVLLYAFFITYIIEKHYLEYEPVTYGLGVEIDRLSTYFLVVGIVFYVNPLWDLYKKAVKNN